MFTSVNDHFATLFYQVYVTPVTFDNKACAQNMMNLESIQLPIDTIIHILSYLSTSDRMSARLVNHSWREASLTMKFLDREALVLDRPGTDNLCQVMEILQHSTRPFYHFIFREVELKINMPIWNQYGPRMKSLALFACELSEKTLIKILKCCTSLKALRISACRECWMSGKLLEDENDIKELSETFTTLWELNLNYNRFLSDVLFNRLVSIFSNLESLNLMGCQISHSGLFYPQNTNTLPEASCSVLTFPNILQYLKRRAHKLKHLNFGYTLIDGTDLTTLSSIEDLKLESLMLQGCYQLTTAGIRDLTKHQKCLKTLDISFCVRITDVSLFCICRNLKKLEVFRIKRCRAVTNQGVQFINSLTNLKELDISEDEQLTDECVLFGLCYKGNDSIKKNSNPEFKSVSIYYDLGMTAQNKTMQIFSAGALNLHEEAIRLIVWSFPNLRVLELSYCHLGVTDVTIKMVFKLLVHLQTLKISHCKKVSDVGLAGIDAGDHAGKQEVMKLCENVSRPSDIKSVFSLIRLKRLQELDLSGCNKITDVSLKHVFAFPELKILDLSQCKQVTHVGLDYLSKNNPAIEDLNLNQCHNISDIGILYLAQRLHRLKRLLIQACSQLTDHTLDSIKVYCKSLRYLDTRHCRGMTVAGLESLTHLIMHIDWIKNTDDIVSPESEVLLPSAPPLPSFASLP